jgi:hypothetical protein
VIDEARSKIFSITMLVVGAVTVVNSISTDAGRYECCRRNALFSTGHALWLVLLEQRVIH